MTTFNLRILLAPAIVMMAIAPAGPQSTFTRTGTATDPSGATAPYTFSITLPTPPRTFYVKGAGSDASDGLSIATAWQTISKVNAGPVGGFRPGDTILFESGQSYLGCLVIAPGNLPASDKARPVVIDSYGLGRATLLSNCPGADSGGHAAKSRLVEINGVSGVTLQNLNLSANGTTTTYGIAIMNDAIGTADTITIQNSDVSGFHTTGTFDFSAEIGVFGYSLNGNCGAINNVKILNNKIHGASGPTSPDDSGISGFGCGKNITNVRYAGNEVYNIGGRANLTSIPGSSGNGIVANSVDGGILELNLVHNNGANANTCGGPSGVWAYSANNIIIQFNEVHHMEPLPSYPGNGACDWTAFDLDGGVTNSIVQHNYSHDNAGPGLLAYTSGPAETSWGWNTFRHNISENDDYTMSTGGASAVLNGGSAGPYYFYNNTVFRTFAYAGTTPPSCWQFGYMGAQVSGSLVINNICVNSGYDQFGRTRAFDWGNSDLFALVLDRNIYYNPNGTMQANYNGSLYATVPAYVTATGKDSHSLTSNPLLANAGAGGECGGATGPQPCPGAYRLMAGSPALGVGANLMAAPYNLNIGTRDYFGNIYPPAAGYNIGADGGAP
jgi:hypothetical protein